MSVLKYFNFHFYVILNAFYSIFQWPTGAFVYL